MKLFFINTFKNQWAKARVDPWSSICGNVDIQVQGFKKDVDENENINKHRFIFLK